MVIKSMGCSSRRPRVRFPALTKCLATIHNSSSKASSGYFWPPKKHQEGMQHSNIHAGKALIHNIKIDLFSKEKLRTRA